MKFTDTRSGIEHNLAFSDVIIKGIAPSKGLFVPTELPKLSREELDALAQMPYWKQAAYVYRLFGIDIDDEAIDEVMRHSYGAQWTSDEVTPVIGLGDDVFLLDLSGGPTSAFKDLALQCMPRFFSEVIEAMQRDGRLDADLLILVATSGDTGKAALEGFADRAHTSIVVFYPEEGVSDLQKRQMQTQTGDNVAVFGVRGNFDDCQNAVKDAFADQSFNERLLATANLKLSSANSINWGRLMPQTVYYLSACARLMASGSLAAGQLIDIAVPTGNFGNILAAWYAKQMGAPIGRLICASNSNNVLTDFITTGVYDVTDRAFYTTPSPSMDILISSNLERLLFHLAGARRTAQWIEQLNTTGRFEVDGETLASLQRDFVGGWIDNDQSLQRVKRAWLEHHVLLDPHTAVALDVALAHKTDNPLLVAVTAHWSKFAPSVLRALLDVGFSDPLPAHLTQVTDCETLDTVIALAPGCSAVPGPIAALGSTPARFTTVIDADPDDIKEAVMGWIEHR